MYGSLSCQWYCSFSHSAHQGLGNLYRSKGPSISATQIMNVQLQVNIRWEALLKLHGMDTAALEVHLGVRVLLEALLRLNMSGFKAWDQSRGSAQTLHGACQYHGMLLSGQCISGCATQITEYRCMSISGHRHLPYITLSSCIPSRVTQGAGYCGKRHPICTRSTYWLSSPGRHCASPTICKAMFWRIRQVLGSYCRRCFPHQYGSSSTVGYPRSGKASPNLKV